MNTSIRKGTFKFYGDSIFPHGLSRSGYFNKRESDELTEYGLTFEGLASGKLLPENEEEAEFVRAMNSDNDGNLYAVKLWKKYLAAIAKSRSHHGFAKSCGRSHEGLDRDLSVA